MYILEFIHIFLIFKINQISIIIYYIKYYTDIVLSSSCFKVSVPITQSQVSAQYHFQSEPSSNNAEQSKTLMSLLELLWK